MSQETLADLMDRWTNDAEFRKQMRSDPEGTIRRHGFELDQSELDAVKHMDWTASDQHLKERVSKISPI